MESLVYLVAERPDSAGRELPGWSKKETQRCF